jgi:uncharacterized protein (DUF433 family)
MLTWEEMVMGLATHTAAAEADSRTVFSTPRTSWQSTPVSEALAFDDFATDLRHDLAPTSRLEQVVVDRLTLAAWRLHLASLDEIDAARDDDGLPPLAADTLRAERSLETALELLETVRQSGWGRASHAPSKATLTSPDVESDDFDAPNLSNEWPTLPDEHAAVPVVEDDAPFPVRWQERLVFDFNVSETSPVVKGTWVTASHVVSLVVDGWTWSDVLRAHPELTEDDIRICLSYTIEQDNQGEY